MMDPLAASMPLFHLHIFDGEARIADPEGSDLADLDAARVEAISAARQMWAAAILLGRDLNGYRFEIETDDPAGGCRIAFDDVLPPRISAALRTS